MIGCPYCTKPLLETSTECPHCQLTLAALGKLMGPTPIMVGGISDGPKVLKSRDITRINKVRQHFQRQFPQSRLNIVMRTFSQDVPFSSILFWLFNTAGLSEEAARRGKNRDILIVIDPKRKEAGLMLGYGLEPFVPQKALDHLVDRAAPLLSVREYAQALCNLIEGLGQLLASISQDISQNLGLLEPLTQETGEYDY